jgi:RNA polymerase sigma-70 factor (ECF subfamily)
MADHGWIVELYRQYRRLLFLAAWNVVRCPALAEDAVHAAFARLAGMASPPNEPKLYAFRAVRNAAVDITRARSRRHEEPIPGEPIEAPHDASMDADDSSAAVAHALEQVDTASREVVELHLHARLTFQEIADILGEPLPTVASRYRRALAKLRSLLEVCHERD